EMLNYSNYDEKVLALESVLEVPPTILRCVRIPPTIEPGPLQTQVLEPMLVQSGVLVASVQQDGEMTTEDGEGEESAERGSSAAAPAVRMPPRFTLARDDEDDYADEDE